MKRGNFDIKCLSEEIKKECLSKMYADEYVEKILQNQEEFKKYGEPMIYLAWLWVNELAVLDNVWLVPNEGYEVNHADYELNDGGWNYVNTLDDINVEDTRPYLKGLFLD